MSITIENNITYINGAKWRLIHDGDNVIALIEGTAGSCTQTQHNVVEYDTETEALVGIEQLGLFYGATL